MKTHVHFECDDELLVLNCEPTDARIILGATKVDRQPYASATIALNFIASDVEFMSKLLTIIDTRGDGLKVYFSLTEILRLELAFHLCLPRQSADAIELLDALHFPNAELDWCSDTKIRETLFHVSIEASFDRPDVQAFFTEYARAHSYLVALTTEYNATRHRIIAYTAMDTYYTGISPEAMPLADIVRNYALDTFYQPCDSLVSSVR